MTAKRNLISLLLIALVLPAGRTCARRAQSRDLAGLLEPIRKQYDLPALAAADSKEPVGVAPAWLIGTDGISD